MAETQIDPLARGYEADLLLRALHQSGVGSENLAFLLGVDPDAIRATLAVITKFGSLRTVPGPDYLTQNTPITTLFAYLARDGAVNYSSMPIEIPASQIYSIVINAASISDPNVMVDLTFSMQTPEAALPVTSRCFQLANGTKQLLLYIPKSTLIVTQSGNGAGGTLTFGAFMAPLPVGGL